jgi:hypothetical protein
LRLELKEEVAERLAVILPKNQHYDYVERKYVTTPQTKWYKNYAKDVKFNGCRTKESRDAKIEKVRKEMVVNMVDRKEKRLNKLLKSINDDLIQRAERLTDEYAMEMSAVCSGKRMDNKWIEETLDNKELKEEVAELKDKIAHLEALKEDLEQQIRIERNRAILNHFEENGWNDDEIEFMPRLKEEFKAMYENEEAFKKEPTFF